MEADHDEAQRAALRILRFWAFVDFLFAAILATLVTWVVPWKTPAANLALLAYAGGLLVSSVGLWQARRWGWRMAAGLALLGIGSGVLLATLLVMSWAFLRTVWGEFGTGASLAALVLAALVLQALVLHPALLLRGLLRREVSNVMGTGRGWRAFLLAMLAIPGIAGVITGATFTPSVLPPLTEAQRDLARHYLRARLDGTSPPGLKPLTSVSGGVGPLVTVLWKAGTPVFEVRRTAPTLAGALAATGDALAERVSEDPELGAGVLRVDRLVGGAGLPSERPWVVAFSADPGVDGLMRGDSLLLPDRMLREGLVAATALAPASSELPIGLAAAEVLRRLGRSDEPLRRLRVESWVEHGDEALPLNRGNTPTRGRGPGVWRQAALDAGHYIVTSIGENGRFQMHYSPFDDTSVRRSYSAPRHAGTAYALALLFGATGDPATRQGAEAALGWLGERLVPCGGEGRLCVARGRRAELGSTALAAVAMLEYQRATGDARWSPQATALLDFILSQQHSDGEFFHRYDTRRQEPDTATRLPFFSEEAAFALAIGFNVLQDPRYLEGARRALDYQTGEKYASFFLGRFMYGLDHWTCIAAEEAWPALSSDRYLDFCLGYTAFMRRVQFRADGAPRGYAGHYGFTYFSVPGAANTAAVTEAVVATFLLARHHGRPTGELYAQLSASLDALAEDQVRADNSYMMPNPSRALGGVRTSLVEPMIRIDNVQHAAVAWLRGSALDPLVP